jgi:tetratricopeptide (TPR) repeat protein
VRAAVLILLLLLSVPLPALAQGTSSRIWDAAVKRGNAAYNDGDYDTARRAYVDAIQASPSKAAAYRNLARTYFWEDRYGAAAAYYDHYLRLAPDAEDIDKVKAERRLAAERARDTVYTVSDVQRRALEALQKELESGRAYTSGGGGAWGLYETLLRTGYAEPQLAQLRARLSRRILDEFDATIVPKSNQLTPRLDLDDWQLQAERLSAARSIADDPALAEILKTRSTVVEAAIAMLTGQWADAAKLARLARTSNPDLGFLAWFEASSLIGAKKYDEALTFLDQLARDMLDRDQSKLDYVRLLRAIALQKLERHDDASELYLEVLEP